LLTVQPGNLEEVIDDNGVPRVEVIGVSGLKKRHLTRVASPRRTFKPWLEWIFRITGDSALALPTSSQ
jgi:hypothetical protein